MSLLPSNSTALERSLESVMKARMDGISVPIRQLWSPDECPTHLLPWLAWALSADQWKSEWSEAQKRSYLRNAYYIHKHKGTLGAVRRLLDSLGFDLRIVEWWETTPRGDPYTFEIRITPEDGDFERALALDWQGLLALAKNVRSHLTKVSMESVIDGAPAIGAVSTYGLHLLIEPTLPDADVYSLETVADQFSDLIETFSILPDA